jgi:hypothetical protein
MTRDDNRAARAVCCRIAVLAAALAALSLPAAVGATSSATPLSHGIAGVVPPRGSQADPSAASAATLAAPASKGELNNPGKAGKAGGKAGSGGNLTWHGGPVMHSSTTYTIFWSSPAQPMPAGYESTINQFFTDVAQDSGGAGNVYSTDPQYTDATDRANYLSTFGGTFDDTTTAIPSHCGSQYGTLTVSGCILDSDLQAEVSHAIAVNHWTAGPSAVFLVFTAPNVGSCADSSSKDCAYKSYCAYHDYFSQGGTPVIYTNQPYTDSSGVGVPGVCDTGQQPNGNWADSTINVASHEHNEAITDPLINAWYDGNGNENGDKCAWNFGASLGGDAGGQWNQVINGHHYYLQQEWDNATKSCVQRTGAVPPPPVPLISGFSPASGSAGTPVTITGAHLLSTSSVKFHGASATFLVVDDGTISTTVPASATSGPITVTTSGGAATSSTSFTVSAGGGGGGGGTPGFTIAISGDQTVSRGQTTTFTVTIVRVNGFTGSVALSFAASPLVTNGPTSSFSPRTIPAGGTTSTVTVKAKRGCPTGTYTLTVTGTKGALVHSATTTLIVQ